MNRSLLLKISCAAGSAALFLTQTAHARVMYDSSTLNSDALTGISRNLYTKPVGIGRRDVNRMFVRMQRTQERRSTSARLRPKSKPLPASKQVTRTYTSTAGGRRIERITPGIRDLSKTTPVYRTGELNRRTRQLLERLTSR